MTRRNNPGAPKTSHCIAACHAMACHQLISYVALQCAVLYRLVMRCIVLSCLPVLHDLVPCNAPGTSALQCDAMHCSGLPCATLRSNMSVSPHCAALHRASRPSVSSAPTRLRRSASPWMPRPPRAGPRRSAWPWRRGTAFRAFLRPLGPPSRPSPRVTPLLLVRPPPSLNLCLASEGRSLPRGRPRHDSSTKTC